LGHWQLHFSTMEESEFASSIFFRCLSIENTINAVKDFDFVYP